MNQKSVNPSHMECSQSQLHVYEQCEDKHAMLCTVHISITEIYNTKLQQTSGKVRQ